MKILLDERLPRKLKNSFTEEHEGWTVCDKGWLSKKNGVLLKLMIDDGFLRQPKAEIKPEDVGFVTA